MIKIIKDDILNFDGNIILHQCNCWTMGSGVAKALYTKYPDIKIQHKYKIEEFKNHRKDLLGEICVASTNKQYKFVINMFSQYHYGNDGKQYTNYDAFKKCLSNVDKLVKKNATIAIPYGIGCVRGGGGWNVIYKIIKDFSKDRIVYLYKLDRN